MSELLNQPSIGLAIGVAIGLPLLMVLLGELSQQLSYRNSPFVRPLRVVRIAVVPLGAVLLLLVRGAQIPSNVGVQILETCFTIAVVVAVLLLVDAVLALLDERATGQRRIPGIFVDLVRVLLVIAGVFIVLATVWTQPVSHFLTALGVTSIVIGIALQSTVGNVVSGLLLLSERPFAIGDWIQVGALTGRVNEINWRAVHLNTGASIQVVPNGMLATSAFANLNRPSADFMVTTTLHFSIADPPDRVCKLLNDVAAGVPQATTDSVPATELVGVDAATCNYETTFVVASYEVSRPARTSFLTRAWFAARRAGLTLAGMPAPSAPDPAQELRSLASVLRLDDDDIAQLAPHVRIEEYAPGEVAQHQGEQGSGLRIVLDGVARRSADVRGRGSVPLGELHRNDAFGVSALTHEPSIDTVVAVDSLTVLMIPSSTLNELLDAKPQLASELGELMERIRTQILRAPTGNGAADQRPGASKYG